MEIKQDTVNVFDVPVFTEQHFAKDRVQWIVLLHDALGSSAQWKRLPQLLFDQTRCNVLTYDRKGYGKSGDSVLPRYSDFMHTEAKKELPELLKILNIQKSIVLGHSDGGSIALMFAKEENCAAVISIAAHAYVEEITVSSIKEAFNSKSKIINSLTKFHGDKAETIFYAWNDTWVTDEFKKWNIWDEVNLGDLPTLLIQGDKDEYGSWQQIEDISAKAVNPKKVKLKGVGHMPHLECPEELASVCANFIQGLE